MCSCERKRPEKATRTTAASSAMRRTSILAIVLSTLSCSPPPVAPFLAPRCKLGGTTADAHQHRSRRGGVLLRRRQRSQASRVAIAGRGEAEAGRLQSTVSAVVAPREIPAAADFEELAAEAASRQEQRSRKLASATSKENTKTDLFRMKKFHHVEFYCGDATATAGRFIFGLGMNLVAKSDQSTGNTQHASYVVQSNDLRFVCTAPYSLATAAPPATAAAAAATAESLPAGDGGQEDTSPLPGFDPAAAHEFFRRHGLAGRAIGIEVEDASYAYDQCIERAGSDGASASVQPPTRVSDLDGRGAATIAEVRAYGDVVLRFISFESESGAGAPGVEAGGVGVGGEGGAFTGAFLPNFVDVGDEAGARRDFGLQRADHIVGNVWDMLEHGEYLTGMTGMHEFAEFAAADVGTGESGLNSIVLASNNEMVLLPLNEPTFGTAKKSQIQTFLEQNDGPGLQHIALKTNDIFRTIRLMRANSAFGGLEFMAPPGRAYYRDVPSRIPSLTEDQLRQLEELGLLADKDDDGVLLQVFTKPVGDRPTLFFEIIQRIGCAFEATEEDSEGDRGVFGERDPDGSPNGQERGSSEDGVGAPKGEVLQRGGCGGFGLGNFKALFEAIEKYESTLATGTGGER
ncbi:unnamed protein product [Scytosiphon promiscuus]